MVLTHTYKVGKSGEACPSCFTKVETAFMAPLGSDDRRSALAHPHLTQHTPTVKAQETTKQLATELLKDYVLGYFSVRQVEGLQSHLGCHTQEKIKAYKRDPKRFCVKRAPKKERHAFQAPPKTLELILECCRTMVEKATNYHGNFVEEDTSSGGEPPTGLPRHMKRTKVMATFTGDMPTDDLCLDVVKEHSTRMSPADVIDNVNVDAMLAAIVCILLVGPGSSFAGAEEIGKDCRNFLQEVLGVDIQRAERSKMTTQRQISQRGTHAAKDKNLFMRIYRKFTDTICEDVKRDFHGFGGLFSVFSMPWAPMLRCVDEGGVSFATTIEDPTVFKEYECADCHLGGLIWARPVFSPPTGFEAYTEFEAASLFEWTPSETGTTFPLVIGALGQIDKLAQNAFATSMLGVACGCRATSEGLSEFTPQFFWCLYLLFLACSSRKAMADKSFAAAFLCIAAWVIMVPTHMHTYAIEEHEKTNAPEKKTEKTKRREDAGKRPKGASTLFPFGKHEGAYSLFWEQLRHLDEVATTIMTIMDSDQRFIRKNINLVLDAIMESRSHPTDKAIAEATCRRFPMFAALTKTETEASVSVSVSV